MSFLLEVVVCLLSDFGTFAVLILQSCVFGSAVDCFDQKGMFVCKLPSTVYIIGHTIPFYDFRVVLTNQGECGQRQVVAVAACRGEVDVDEEGWRVYIRTHNAFENDKSVGDICIRLLV